MYVLFVHGYRYGYIYMNGDMLYMGMDVIICPTVPSPTTCYSSCSSSSKSAAGSCSSCISRSHSWGTPNTK